MRIGVLSCRLPCLIAIGISLRFPRHLRPYACNVFGREPTARATGLAASRHLIQPKIRNSIAKVCASSRTGVAQNKNLRKPCSIFISPRSRSISCAVALSCCLTSSSVSSTCSSARAFASATVCVISLFMV